MPPRVVVSGGTLSLLYHFAKKLAVKFVQFFRRCAKIILIAIIAFTALRIVQYRRKVEVTLEEPIEEPIPDKVVLIVCDDIFAHDGSRKALLQILENPSFFAVIPACGE